MDASTELRLRQLPVWNGAIASIVPLEGGLSNESYVVADEAGKHVARFGEDYPFHEVSRERELMIARAAQAAGFGPAVEYTEPGLTVSAFIEAKTLRPEDVRAVPERIADLLRRFHTTMPKHVSGTAYLFWVFHMIREYARRLEQAGSPATSELAKHLALADELEAAQAPMPIVFAHNDLLPANFLDDTNRLWLIDFEYAGFSTPMFDLAAAAANAGMDDAQSLALLEAYFGAPASDGLQCAYAAMQCAVMLREAMWGLVSDIYLKAPGADYKAYAADNLTRLDGAIAAYRSKFSSR